MDESRFLLGIDVGGATGAIAYFEARRGMAEVIDVSGGYGKPNAPTALRYIPETREWVFGEYAVLGEGGALIDGLPGRLARGEAVEIDGKPYGAEQVMGVYIGELIANCRGLNPKADVAGLTVVMAEDAGDEEREAMRKALHYAGYGDVAARFERESVCVFTRFYKDRPIVNERVLLLDFGGGALRGGLYDAAPEGGGVRLSCLSAFEDEGLGAAAAGGAAANLFTRFYREGLGLHETEELTEQAAAQLAAFTYQHKELLFRGGKGKPPKLYYNFAYPPFQRALTAGDAEGASLPLYERAKAFIAEGAKGGGFEDAAAVALCVGGGYEAAWAQMAVRDALPGWEVVTYKNPKGAACEGACLIAAGAEAAGVTDLNRVKADVGLAAYDGRFALLARQGAGRRQKGEAATVILREAVGAEPVRLTLYTRDGELTPLAEITLEGLPERPAGVTRLRVCAVFETFNLLSVTVTDMGFGELFRRVDYERKFSMIV